MVGVKVEHVLILAIVAFVIYYLSSCRCFNNGFRVGGTGDQSPSACAHSLTTNCQFGNYVETIDEDYELCIYNNKTYPSEWPDYRNRACNNVNEINTRCGADGWQNPIRESVCRSLFPRDNFDKKEYFFTDRANTNCKNCKINDLDKIPKYLENHNISKNLKCDCVSPYPYIMYPHNLNLDFCQLSASSIDYLGNRLHARESPNCPDISGIDYKYSDVFNIEATGNQMLPRLTIKPFYIYDIDNSEINLPDEMVFELDHDNLPPSADQFNNLYELTNGGANISNYIKTGEQQINTGYISWYNNYKFTLNFRVIRGETNPDGLSAIHIRIASDIVKYFHIDYYLNIFKNKYIKDEFDRFNKNLKQSTSIVDLIELYNLLPEGIYTTRTKKYRHFKVKY